MMAVSAVPVGVNSANAYSAFWILSGCWTCNADFILVPLVVWGLWWFCFFLLSHFAFLSSEGVNWSNCYLTWHA